MGHIITTTRKQLSLFLRAGQDVPLILSLDYLIICRCLFYLTQGDPSLLGQRWGSSLNGVIQLL